MEGFVVDGIWDVELIACMVVQFTF